MSKQMLVQVMLLLAIVLFAGCGAQPTEECKTAVNNMLAAMEADSWNDDNCPILLSQNYCSYPWADCMKLLSMALPDGCDDQLTALVKDCGCPDLQTKGNADETNKLCNPESESSEAI